MSANLRLEGPASWRQNTHNPLTILNAILLVFTFLTLPGCIVLISLENVKYKKRVNFDKIHPYINLLLADETSGPSVVFIHN